MAVSEEQQQLHALITSLKEGKHLIFLQHYKQASERLQCWLSQPLQRLFPGSGSVPGQDALLVPALEGYMQINIGMHTIAQVAEALMFVGNKVDGSWLPLFSSSEPKVCAAAHCQPHSQLAACFSHKHCAPTMLQASTVHPTQALCTHPWPKWTDNGVVHHPIHRAVSSCACVLLSVAGEVTGAP